MNREKILKKITEKYPAVKPNAGYIPQWVFFFEGHPVVSKAIVISVGLVLGVLLASLIPRIL